MHLQNRHLSLMRRLDSSPGLEPSSCLACAQGLDHDALPKTEREPLLKKHVGADCRLKHYEEGDEIPDGGLQAWLQVVGSFVLMFNCWGIVNCFGAYQTYYRTALLHDSSPSAISLIGSVQAFLLIFVGVLTGPLFDNGYFRVLIFSGSFLMVAGTIALSFCTSYWQIVVAQAVCVGLGSACLFVPGIAIVITYFSSKKALATGIASSGSSLGGVTFSYLFSTLQPRIGFPWTTRILAFIMLCTLTIPLASMKVRLLPPKRRQLLQLPAFKEPAFTLYSIGILLGFTGLYIPFFHVQNYAIQNGIMGESKASWLLLTLNFASMVGRIVPNFFADRTGPMNMLIPCVGMAACLGLAWIAIHVSAWLFVFCGLYGFFSGTFVSLPPAVVVGLSPSLNVVGVRMGMSFVFAAVGLLIGNPIAGVILNACGWEGLQVFCGVMVSLSTIVMLAARFSMVGAGMGMKA